MLRGLRTALEDDTACPEDKDKVVTETASQHPLERLSQDRKMDGADISQEE